MIDYSIQNKKAWEYNAYEFWVKQSGTPVDRAKRDLENPMGMLKRYRESLLLWRVNSKIAIKLEFISFVAIFILRLGTIGVQIFILVQLK